MVDYYHRTDGGVLPSEELCHSTVPSKESVPAKNPICSIYWNIGVPVDPYLQWRPSLGRIVSL